VAGGTSTTLFSSGTPVRRSFLKYDLAELAGKTLSSIKLRIHTTNNTSSGSINTHNVYLVDYVSSIESSVSYNSPVAVTSTILGTIPVNTTNTWYDITLPVAPLQPKVDGRLSLENRTCAGVAGPSPGYPRTISLDQPVSYRRLSASLAPPMSPELLRNLIPSSAERLDLAGCRGGPAALAYFFQRLEIQLEEQACSPP
jgi:hypothetical protein